MYDEMTKEELVERLEKKDKKWKQMVLKEHNLTEALLQTTHQLDYANEMIANLLRSLREKNQLYAAVDNDVESTSNTV